MPRKLRVHYNHAMYHVMNQGNYRQSLFFDEDDFSYAYWLLERIVNNYGCKLHLFCLMTNHVHFLIEVDQIPLSKIMQSFSASYSKYINKKKDRCGHLFRGRYKEKIVQDERYILELCYYIHNNPLSAHMVKTLEDYPWSSHHVYTQRQTFDWVTTDLIMSLLSPQVNTSQSYKDFMLNRRRHDIGPQFCKLDDTNGCLIMSDSINAAINVSKGLDLRCLSLKQIIDTVCAQMGVSLAIIHAGYQQKSIIETKSLIAYFAHYHGQYTLASIAWMLNTRADTLSKTMRRQFESVKKCKAFKKKIEFLKREFLDVCLQLKRDGA
ncbi:MAG: hypothetical protein COB66_00170 [Coxiella sp. (in: Bacteria)]|nr:MAG: hypothetical protein COB66_00170 [Coxiella sp. (in: g-proteobacteria)]